MCGQGEGVREQGMISMCSGTWRCEDGRGNVRVDVEICEGWMWGTVNWNLSSRVESIPVQLLTSRSHSIINFRSLYHCA